MPRNEQLTDDLTNMLNAFMGLHHGARKLMKWENDTFVSVMLLYTVILAKADGVEQEDLMKMLAATWDNVTTIDPETAEMLIKASAGNPKETPTA